MLAADFYLFDVESKVKWVVRRGNVAASTNFAGQSEPNGMMINYYLKGPVQGDVVVKVMQGTFVLAETKGPNGAGINQVLWNMRGTLATAPGPGRGAGGRTRRRAAGGRRGGLQAPAPYATFGGTLPAESASTPSS